MVAQCECWNKIFSIVFIVVVVTVVLFSDKFFFYQVYLVCCWVWGVNVCERVLVTFVFCIYDYFFLFFSFGLSSHTMRVLIYLPQKKCNYHFPYIFSICTKYSNTLWKCEEEKKTEKCEVNKRYKWMWNIYK